MSDEDQIRKVIFDMNQAIASRDEGSVMDQFADDASIFVISAMYEEKTTSLEQLRTQISDILESSDVSHTREATITNLQIHRDIAWYASDIELAVSDSQTRINWRDTGVLRKFDEGWKIVQRHVSLPATPELARGSFSGLRSFIDSWIDSYRDSEQTPRRDDILTYLIKARELMDEPNS